MGRLQLRGRLWKRHIDCSRMGPGRRRSPGGQPQESGQHVCAGRGAVGHDLLDGRRKLSARHRR